MSNEIYERFRSLEEWQAWVERNVQVFSRDHQAALIDLIRTHGVTDPLSRAHSGQVSIGSDNYRETVKAGRLISRHRALLLELVRLASAGKHRLTTRDCKMFAPEGLTEFALYLRSVYPKFIGSEYSQTDEERRALYPIPSEDLHALSFPSGVFDLALSNDVFEHLYDLNRALREIHRVLNSTGVLVATFPFLYRRKESTVRARLVDGRIEHLMEPEVHGNPMRPGEGSLVFEVPGWDIVERARAAGFSDSYFAFISSVQYGVVGKDINGVFVFVAVK